MKKISSILIAGFFLLSVPAFTQIQQGNILAGGDIASFDLGLEKGSAFNMTINPKLGFFIKDNLAVGPDILLGLTSFSGETSFSYGIGALGRYYFSDKENMSPLRHSRFFVEGTAGFRGFNVSGGGSSTNGLGLGVGPGLAYFITPNIGLEALLKYNGLVGFGNETTQSSLNLSVGFQIYLPSKNLKNKVANDVK
ncbi:MAG: outer membrane beta-barrel protein [Ginsengibacter sp.]